MLHYSAYGLKISSDFPIPEFRPSPDDRPDVAVRLDRGEPPADLMARHGCVELNAGDATLAFERVAVFRIHGGREIVVNPIADIDLPLVRLYLVGKVMATLLYQRGLLVLHASAVEIDGKAVAFVGTSGFGKSSLAASLHACGHNIIADDVVAVELGSHALAIPAFPQLKLDPDMAHFLGHDAGSLSLLHPLEPKRGLRVSDQFATARSPLALIYLLGTDPIGVSCPLPPQETLIELVRHSFPARLLRSGGGAHLRQCVSLARLVPILRFGRPRSRMQPSALADRVRHDLMSVDAPASRGSDRGTLLAQV
jgi:hypothetical protein